MVRVKKAVFREAEVFAEDLSTALWVFCLWVLCVFKKMCIKGRFVLFWYEEKIVVDYASVDSLSNN